MSFITFAKAALGDELSELGFERKSGVDWFKLIDECIWLRFRFRNLGYGNFELNFGIQSLFSELCDDTDRYTNLRFDAARQYRQRELAKGVEFDRINVFPVYEDENSDRGRAAIAHVKEMFSAVSPILVSVTDLASCKRAIDIASYTENRPHLSFDLDAELARIGYAAWPPESAFFILCRLGRYEEAADYLKREQVHYARMLKTGKTSPDIAAACIEHEKERVQPYIDMIERGEFDRIKQLMRENYNNGCDTIENKFKIVVDRSRISFD